MTIDPQENIQIRFAFDDRDKPTHGWVFTVGMADFDKPELEMRDIPMFLFDAAGQVINHVAGILLNNSKIGMDSVIEIAPMSRLTFKKAEPLPEVEEFYENERWTIVETGEYFCSECGGYHEQDDDITPEDEALFCALEQAFPEHKTPDAIFKRMIELGIYVGEEEDHQLSDEARELIRKGDVNELVKRVAKDWVPS